jgi:hypothetical protein
MAVSAAAQTPVPSPTPSTTRLAWTHDGVNTDRYELSVDGAITDLGPLTPYSGTEYRIPFPALTPGSHTLIVRACNVAGCAASEPFPVQVVVQPAAPAALRIVTQ